MANSLKENIEGRYVVLKESAMAPSYRVIEQRIFLVEGGFGASSFTAGTAIIGVTPIDNARFRMGGFDIERYATDEEIALVTSKEGA